MKIWRIYAINYILDLFQIFPMGKVAFLVQKKHTIYKRDVNERMATQYKHFLKSILFAMKLVVSIINTTNTLFDRPTS